MAERRLKIIFRLFSGVYKDSENKAVLTEEESKLKMAPINIAWHKRKLTELRGEWIVNSAFKHNKHVLPNLRESLPLTMKLITKIDLSNNDLSVVPLVVFKLPSLKQLNLADNLLTELPLSEQRDRHSTSSLPNDLNKQSEAEFTSTDYGEKTSEWNCPALEDVELQGNQLTSLPLVLFQLPVLKTLNACWNQIDHLPFEMWIAPSLKNLLLKKNKLYALPTAYGKSRKIKRSKSAPGPLPEM